MSETYINEAKRSLERVQSFDVKALPQAEKLGQDFNFEDAVEPAIRIIGLFSQFPVQYVPELPSNHVQTLKNQADSFYNVLTEITGFDPRQSDAYGRRTNLIDGLKQQYQAYFDSLHPLISYGASRLRDYSALEREARAAMQAAQDRASEIARELEGQRQEAQRILEEVRKTAWEQGVSQQASYFKEESANHEIQAETWRKTTIGVAVGLGVYAATSIALHKIPWLAPSSTYDAAQIAISKILLFAVIAYMLFLSSRNFLSHKHNAIVNRHRQNALLTFKALSDAAGAEEKRDIVLTYAAACIFAPQETGYTKGGGQTEMPTNIIQAIPKLSPGTTAQ